MNISKNIIKNLAGKFGTPFYLYDSAVMEESYQQLRETFKEFNIFYSLKANPNISVVSAFNSMGSGAELSSYYELEAALMAGFEAKNIIFVGPAKTEHEIEKCIEHQIFAIVCESINELDRISRIASKKNKIARVALRINPSFLSKTALLKMGGKPSQFGIDEELIFSHKKKWLHQKNIKLVGIHVYNGTRILDEYTIFENTLNILKLAINIQTKWEIDFEMLDIGGGLGIPYFDDEKDIDMNVLKEIISPLIEEYLKRYPKTRLIIESGRFLMAKAGLLVCQIIDIKESKGENFIVADAGIHCHMAAGGIGSVIKKNFPICLIKRKERKNKTPKKYHISGPLCTPSDLIGKNVKLEEAEIGDLVIINHSGAYGPSASPIMFLSHGFPAEILYKNNNAYLIRKRFSSEEFFKGQILIK